MKYHDDAHHTISTDKIRRPSAASVAQATLGNASEIEAFATSKLPADDYVCFAAKLRSGGMVHGMFKDRAEGAHWAAAKANRGLDVYISISTYDDHSKGRNAQNVAGTRVHILDLDVGSGTHKFTSKRDAFVGLIAFCKKLEVPIPVVVDSGNGLHTWWEFDDPIPPDQWRQTAQWLKDACRHDNFPADPTRTADITSLLRVPGTFNFKDRENPKPVRILWGSGHAV